MEIDRTNGSLALSELRRLVKDEDFETLASAAEEYELDVYESKDGMLNAEAFVLYMLGYFVRFDLNKARHLWKRIPSNLKEDSELKAVWQIGRCLWRRKYQEIFQSLSYEWKDNAARHVAQHLRGLITARVFVVVGQSYSAIGLHDLSQKLSLSPTDTIEACVVQGWQVRKEEHIVLPVSQSEPLCEPLAEAEFRQLADYVSQLEA